MSFVFYPDDYNFSEIIQVSVGDLQNFNSGHRILKGDFPFRDYYSITGPILDIWQSIIYKIFGSNWQSLIIHASLLNCALSISVFIFLD